MEAVAASIPVVVGSPLRHSFRWVAAALASAVIALAAHAFFLGFDGLYGLFGNGVDAVVYRHGGVTVLGSDRLYSFTLFDTALPFTYPPFAAVVFTGLAALSVEGALMVVNGLNLVLLYLAVLLSWRALGYRGRATHVVSIGIAIALTWLEPIRMTLWLGQINLLLLVVVLWDLGRPEGSRLRGIGVGAAAGLKLTPAFFVFYLLTLRQWRAAIVAGTAFAVTVVVGFAVVFSDARSYWTSAIFESDRIGLLASPANQSVHGLLARSWTGGVPPFAVWFLCSGVVAALGLWAAVVAHRSGSVLLGLTICGLTTPMVSPFSWGHHWVWCVPLIVLTLDFARRLARWWTYMVPVVVALPLMAWYYTTPSGVAVIGTFMFGGANPAHVMMQNAYTAVFFVVVAAVLIPHLLRSSAADDRPRSELGVETHGCVRRTRRREQGRRNFGGAGRRRCIPAIAGFGLGAVEEDAVDRRVRFEERDDVVYLDGGFDDRGVEASCSRAQLHHIPDGDTVAS